VPERLDILFYEYVPDMAERRGPYRDGHVALIARWHEEGRVAMAGALGDPPHGGAIVLRADDAQAAAEEFVAEDPYVAAELVTSWRLEPWTVVT
jgi:uncharacterized protein